MMFSLLLVAFAHADYFQTERQFQEQDAARARAEAEVRAADRVARHNADLSAVVTNFAAKYGGASNLRSQGCGDSYCSRPWDLPYRLSEGFIDIITFDIPGYQCYARLWPVGRAIACVNPQTRARIDIDDSSANGSLTEKKKRHPRRRE